MLRLAADEDFNGRIIRGVLRRLPQIEDIVLLAECSEEREWDGQVIYLPF